MSFKLGTNKGLEARGGEIKTKMRFGKEAGDIGSVPGTPVIRVPLDEGVMGEANMDGTIYVNENITPGGFEDRKVINHEMRHATDIKIGKLAYSDDDVTYNGQVYPRQTIDGKDMIIVDGVAKEAGSHDFPWEVEANNGNKK